MVSPGFRRTRRGTVARFAPGEADVLAHLVEQLLDLIGADDDEPGADTDPLEALAGFTDGPLTAPTDPVLARLLPDAYRDDPDRAAEFRRFTEDDLRSSKRAAARTVLATLPRDGEEFTLDADETERWLGALNDLRLALGTRLDVTEESYAEFEERADADVDDPRVQALSVYIWLGYLQESLVRAMS